MADIRLVRKYLPQDLRDIASSYDISDEYLVDMPDLIEMILRSKSIETQKEKQEWLSMLIIMNSDQIDKLRAILEKERVKLKEIEDRYEEKKTEIKKKYLLKWQQMGYIKKVTQIHEQEEQSKVKEDEEADKLLEMI